MTESTSRTRATMSRTQRLPLAQMIHFLDRLREFEE